MKKRNFQILVAGVIAMLSFAALGVLAAGSKTNGLINGNGEIKAARESTQLKSESNNEYELLRLPDPQTAYRRLMDQPDDPLAMASLTLLPDEEFVSLTGGISKSDAIQIAGGDPTDKARLLSSAIMPYQTENGIHSAWGVRKSRFEIIAIDIFTGEKLGEINRLEKDPQLLQDVMQMAETQEGQQALITGYNQMQIADQTHTTSTPYGYQTCRELEYALSASRRNGSSNISYNGYTMGDWNYHASNSGVTNDAKTWPRPYYDCGAYGSVTSRGYQGGYCKFAAACIIRRATGFGWIPDGYDYCRVSSGECWVGDVLQKNSPSPHTAVVYMVLAMDGNGRTCIVDLVDSNYIGGDGSYLLGRHPMSRTGKGGLSDLGSYRTWWP